MRTERLKALVADLSLDKEALKAVIRKTAGSYRGSAVKTRKG
jgi:hypothetical protein